MRTCFRLCLLFLALCPATLLAQPPTQDDPCLAVVGKVKHADALMDFCHWVNQSRASLPDVMVEQFTTRKRLNQVTRNFDKIDEVTAHIRYSNGSPTFFEAQINGKPVSKDNQVREGMWSNGEYFPIIESIVRPEQKARFEFDKEFTRLGRRLLRFTYKVEAKNNHLFSLMVPDRNAINPKFEGVIDLDADTHDLVSLSHAAIQDIDRTFPIAFAFTVVKYDKIHLANNTDAILPVSSHVENCSQSRQCFENDIEFKNWRKFGAEHRILLDGVTVPPATEAAPKPQN